MFMHYPEEFKKEVLSTFEGMSYIEEALNSGSDLLGWYLGYSCENSNISAEEIVKAIESEDLESLYNKAKKIIAIKSLYRQWEEMFDDQMKKQREYGKPNKI